MNKPLRCGAVSLLLVPASLNPTPAGAQGTAFTYQGRLNAGGSTAGIPLANCANSGELQITGTYRWQ